MRRMITRAVRMAVVLLMIGGTLPTAMAETDQPPNFLIILGDDISASFLGCYGSLNPNTSPNIDKLASEGIRFSNMFVSEAICAPTRAELYTGLQPERNGCMRNHMATDVGTKSVVPLFEGTRLSRWIGRKDPLQTKVCISI